MTLKLSHKTLREQVVIVLRNRILNGDIKPGEKIKEVEISDELGVSRGPVREALRQIEQEGLVTYSSNKGCTVKILEPNSMSEIYLLRSSLEVLAVKTYRGKMKESTIEQLQEITKNLGECAKIGDFTGIVENDQKFHFLIVQESEIKRLIEMWSSLDGENAAIYYSMKKSDLMPYELLERNHKIIADVFKTGDYEKICDEIQKHYMCVPEFYYTKKSIEPDEIIVKLKDVKF